MTFPVFALFFEKWNISLGRDSYPKWEGESGTVA